MITKDSGPYLARILRDHGNRLCLEVQGLPPGRHSSVIMETGVAGARRGGAGARRGVPTEGPGLVAGLGRGGEGAGQAGQGAVAAEQLDRLIQWR
jgi:hypothetical protein